MYSAETYDEDVLRAIAESGARTLLIGRRALVVLGLPVMTSDYDVWVHIDDIEKLDAAFARLDHHPNHTPEEARKRGRYVLENDQHVDVLVARRGREVGGVVLSFDDAWARRVVFSPYAGVDVPIPCIDDLVTTKRWASRARDVAPDARGAQEAGEGMKRVAVDEYDQPLPEEEFEERVRRAIAELDGEEGEHLAELIAWFRRRHPTPAARLRHARRQYEDWTRSRGLPLRRPQR